MNNLNRNHSEDSSTGGDDYKKAPIQIIIFFLIWLIPSFVWNTVVFNVLPAPDALTEFLEANKKDNMLFVMFPSFVWMIGGIFYGFKKGYLNKHGGGFGSG